MLDLIIFSFVPLRSKRAGYQCVGTHMVRQEARAGSQVLLDGLFR
jgi:hypothetical protein